MTITPPPQRKNATFDPGDDMVLIMTFIDLTLHQQWRCGIRPDAISQVECQRAGLSHRLFDQFYQIFICIFVRNVLCVHLRIFRLTLVDFQDLLGFSCHSLGRNVVCGSRSHENWASKLRAFYLKKQS